MTESRIAITPMFPHQSRDQLRQFYFNVWRKHSERLPLEPLEALVADVISRHPEYHALLENEDRSIDRDFTPEAGQTNPFLHMGLHIALAEQRAARRPAAVAETHARLARSTGDPHRAEHLMMECLAEALWQAQRKGGEPDEAAYVECLKRLAG